MSASITDTSFNVTSYGKTSFYSGVKGFGNIMINPEFGLYDNKKPYAHTCLNFLPKIKCGWEEGENFERLDTRLDNPTYGSIDVDFDTKTITDNNGYGDINCFYSQWIQGSLKVVLIPRSHDCGVLSKRAMLEHLKHKRFEFYEMNQTRDERLQIEYPDNPEEFLKFLNAHESYNSTPRIPTVWVKLPEGWLFKA